MNTTEVENFPGFQNGITGPELMMEMRAQAERFGADLRAEMVDRVELDGAIKKVVVGDEEYFAKAIILATGAAARMLGIPGEQELMGRGVSSCATCDGFFFKGTEIAVVGGGDSAMEEATFLTKFADKVTIVHRREGFRASPIMLERARNNDKIDFALNKTVTAVKETDNKVSAITLRDTETGEERDLPVKAMFVAIGHDPRSGFLDGQVELRDGGYVATDDPSTRTSVPGVFAAGDLVDDHYRQAITAAGMGCRAALDAQHFLASLND